MYLVDTNVVSELPRARPAARVVAWLEAQPTLTVSAVTVEELAYGVARGRGAAGERLRRWFEGFLALEPTVLPVDARIARTAGELRAARENRGHPVAQADMLIAATALVEGRVLVTRNTDDFEGCGVSLLNPFRS